MQTVQIFQPTHILTSINAVELQDWAAECLSSGHTSLLIDMQRVSFMDSSGLGALLSTQKMVNSKGGKLGLCRISGQARMLFEMTTTSQLFSVYASPKEFERAVEEVTPC